MFKKFAAAVVAGMESISDERFREHIRPESHQVRSPLNLYRDFDVGNLRIKLEVVDIRIAQLGALGLIQH